MVPSKRSPDYRPVDTLSVFFAWESAMHFSPRMSGVIHNPLPPGIDFTKVAAMMRERLEMTLQSLISLARQQVVSWVEKQSPKYIRVWTLGLTNVIRKRILYRCDSVKDFDVGRLSWMIRVGLRIQSQMSREENTARGHTQRRGEDNVPQRQRLE